MTDHTIVISQALLKKLEGQMKCLNSLVSQMNLISSQFIYVSSGLEWTWTAIKEVQEKS